MKHALRLGFALLSCAVASGCTQIEKTPDGAWKYRSLLNRKSIAELTLTPENGLKVRGYSSSQAENIEAAARGTAAAFLGGTPK